MAEIVNKAKLANILGKTERHLTELQKEGMPIHRTAKRGQSSQYNTRDVIEWLIGRARNGKAMDDARLRLVLSQARKTELECDELEGRLIPEERVEDVWSKMITTFRAKILSIPNRLAPQLATIKEVKKIEKLIKDKIYEALKELSEYDPAHYRERAKGSAKGSENRGTAARANAH